MLPITSPFDTYRVGLWAVRKNLGLVAGYVLVMSALNLLTVALDAETALLEVGAAVLGLVIVAALAAQFLITAALVYPLHATFLSDGRTTGLGAIESPGRYGRIAWRLFVIAALAFIPAILVILPIGFAIGDTAFQAEGAAEERLVDWLIVSAFCIIAVFFGLSIILFGPHIPDIVTGNDARPGPSSFQRGTRHFWRMARNLVAGPGLVLAGIETINLLTSSGAADEAMADWTDPATLGYGVIEAAVSAYASAMTAGILSDAYRRALASEAE